MNIKPSLDSTPDMFEGGILNATPQKQQSPLDEVSNGASDSIIEAIEEYTVQLFNNKPLHGAMVKMMGGCPVEIRRSVIENATQYGGFNDNALYGLAVFDLFDENLQPTGAVFTNPTIEGFKDIVFGHGGLYFNRSKLNKLPLIVTDDIHLAFKTAYPVYAPYQTDKIKAYTLKALMQAHPNLCVIAPVHQQDDIKRRYTDLDVKLAFIPEPPNFAMPQDELDCMIKAAVEKANGIEWGEPEPIKSELLPVQQLSQDMLPLEFKEYVFDEAIGADNMSPDMVAACLITSFASLIGAKVGVKPKTYSNWTIVPNLWGGIVAPPSSKKSPAFNAGTYPLDRLVASAREEFKEAQKKHEVLSFAKDADKSALKSKLKDASKKGDEEKQKQIVEEMMQLEEEAQPILRRYKTNDSSPEALAELEKQNPNGVLVLRDELTGWLESVDKDPSERAFYLEAFNGDKPYEFDRILRGHGYIENHCLSILGGIQPDKLITYLEPSIKGMGNDGLFQRFQVLVYPDATEWKYVDRIPNKLARNEVFELFKQVDEMDEYSLVKMGANPTDDYNTRPFFRFGQKAQELYVKWTTDLHKNKVENEEHSIIAQHLQKYPKLMASLALIFHIIDGVKFGTVGDISEQSAEMAIQWCEYLESHARRIYGLVLDAATIKASSIGQKLLKLDVGHDWRIKGFKAREIHRKNWKGLTDIESVENALELLVDNNWLVLEEIEPTVKGGRPSKQYWINPKIYEMS